MTTYVDGNIFTAANANDLQGRSSDYGLNVVRDLGATGNGSTDDRAAIQAGITLLASSGNGGTLFFPAGTYLIGTPGLVFPAAVQRSITLQGVSTGSSASLSRPSALTRNGTYPILSWSATGALSDATLNHSQNINDMTLMAGVHTSTLVRQYRMANCFWNRVTLKGTSTDAATPNLLGNGMGLEGQTLWNCHYTDCYFTGCGAGPTQTPANQPAVLVTDTSGVASSGSNSVHFTACEFEGNYWDDIQCAGSTQVAAGVLITGCKFERGNGAGTRVTTSNGVTIVGNYYFQDQNSPATIVTDSAAATMVAITGNVLAGASATLPTNMIQLVTGNYISITGNTFLGAANHVRMESGMGSVSIVGNHSSLFNTPTIISDARTTKVGLIGSNGRIHAYDGIGTKIKAGAITDADFQQTPVDGTIAVDSSATSKLWVRVGGTWKSVTVA